MVRSPRQKHWDDVYGSKSETAVSWYQKDPRLSLELITRFVPVGTGRIIDVGGGASVLVDRLLRLSFARIAVLDVSTVALAKSRDRLGGQADGVEWIAADITTVEDLGVFDFWHDRAVFHFLTDRDDRRKYVETARRTIARGGHLMIAAFADDGPTRCSNLDVRRYNAETMSAELGEEFTLVEQAGESHPTPSGSSQAFFHGVFQRR